jgi:hypothetical protein
MTIKQGALALTVLSSAALFAGPAVANSIHDEGDFGGGYRPSFLWQTIWDEGR